MTIDNFYGKNTTLCQIFHSYWYFIADQPHDIMIFGVVFTFMIHLQSCSSVIASWQRNWCSIKAHFYSKKKKTKNKPLSTLLYLNIWNWIHISATINFKVIIRNKFRKKNKMRTHIQMILLIIFGWSNNIRVRFR